VRELKTQPLKGKGGETVSKNSPEKGEKRETDSGRNKKKNDGSSGKLV